MKPEESTADDNCAFELPAHLSIEEFEVGLGPEELCWVTGLSTFKRMESMNGIILTLLNLAVLIYQNIISHSSYEGMTNRFTIYKMKHYDGNVTYQYE